MKFEELIILLPCHSLEDFPLYHEKEAAEGLLSAWSAMWHPALLASAGKTPTWARADGPPDQLASRLLIVPQVSESLLQAGWAARALNEGACVVRKTTDRQEIVKQALAALDDPGTAANAVLVPDFLALGFCFLQVELLTRQMRYMSNLDEKHFRDRTLAAAQASMGADVSATRKHLQECFDVLLEARERFYPAQAYLIDITLVAPTTLGQPLRDELAHRHPSPPLGEGRGEGPLRGQSVSASPSPQPSPGVPGEGVHAAHHPSATTAPRNIVASAHTVAEMAHEPDTLKAFRAALESGQAALIGGEFYEHELPLLPIESTLAELRRGLAVYQRHLGQRPTVFGRRRFGLAPVLPLLLNRMGFSGAMHFTLDDGQFPREGQSKTRWEGFASSAIDSVTRVPLDANLSETFLGFAQKMGESMDLDHVAMVGLAHWPGQARPWYDDLRRIAAYAPVLGRFITIPEFLAQTAAPGHSTRFISDQYRAPYLKQTVIRRQPDALKRIARQHRWQAGVEAYQALETLAALLSGTPPVATGLAVDVERAYEADAAQATAQQHRLNVELARGLQHLADALPNGPADPTPGLLVVNPHSFIRRVAVPLPDELAAPMVAGPVKRVQDVPGRRLASVEVPALGYAWVAAGRVETPAAPRKKTADKPLAEGEHVRNEFFEVRIDPTTGGIRAFHDYKQRTNLFSQHLGFRLPQPRPKPGDVWRDPDLEAEYAAMVADSVEVTSTGPVLGEITSRGRLVDPEGKVLANFEQKVQAWRGSPVLNLEIHLDIHEEPRADPWNSYYASRFAWGDSGADIRRSVSGVSHPTEAKKLEAPLFVELRSEKHSMAILPGGLPYHRRIGMRMLDTLLVVRGDTARTFRLGIGLNLPYPAQAAWGLITPLTAHLQTAPAPVAGPSSWFCHIDLKNVMATHWSPLVAEGRVVGLRTRLLETEGRPGRAKLSAFRPFASARHVDFEGHTLAELNIEEGAVMIDFACNEWVEVEARFA